MEGRVIGSAGIGIDVTEHRKLEEDLRRAEKMEALGQLAGGVAHDLNNVLGVLVGYSELLAEKIPEGNPLRKYAANILNSSEKGASIIQDLLTLARRGVSVSVVVNINSIVSDFLGSPVFEKMKDYHPHATFRTELDKELFPIKGSPIHLEKTVMNLISNAAEAITGEGEVVIRTENRYVDKSLRGYDHVCQGEYAVLTVSDSGSGIAAADLDKIFEPFYTKKIMGRSGTGLGLAVVWGTVKDHNGYIDVQSEKGKGSTFTLFFPVTREKLAEELKKIPLDQYRGRGESILVVDDVVEQREMAAGMLANLGYDVAVVPSGEEAVEYLKTHKVDLLVLDMIMEPGMDGLETYRRALTIAPGQKAIIVSGYSETDRVKTAQRLGAGAYVRKPYVLEKIGLAIRHELNR
ncbi:MAG: ATP-binding protein, partial [Deltaproteobacteria bacterium]|nr:ATP-binding protein [Deltaproteobacteria bacterium]